MKHRWDFFKESDSSFGVFYPLHYVVAGFDTEDHANRTADSFRDGGFADDDVTTASGDYVTRKIESQDGANWLDRMKSKVSDFIGTETGFIDDDLKLARRGGAFLFAYTPDHASRDRALELLRRAHPIFARRYLHAGVERLLYPPQSTL